MALIGAHVSSAGSILKTFERAEEIGAEVFQFFLRGPRSWRWKGLSREVVEGFRKRKANFGPIVVHAPYLINLASPDETLRRRSTEVFIEELMACDSLGVDFYNLHPGVAKGISVSEGVRNVIASLERIFLSYEPKRTVVLLENTAGGKGDVGSSFCELSVILREFSGVNIGLCLDTCHAFASGYEINTERGFEAFLRELDKLGIENVRAVHANDSKFPLGSRKDRHEHIGEGYIGFKGFENLLRHQYLGRLPYYIETPKEGDMDRVNIGRLKAMS